MVYSLYVCMYVFADVVHTVDPFDVSDEGTNVTHDVESNFYSNVSNCPSGNKIISHKMISDDFFTKNNDEFDLIYVDGSHEPEDVVKDLNNSLKRKGLSVVVLEE